MDPTFARVMVRVPPVRILRAQYYEKMQPGIVREKRKSPFTNKEKKFLAILASRYAEIIESKKTDIAFMSKKMEAWEAITAEFNSARLVTQQASLQQLKKLWQNMKNRMRIKIKSKANNGDGDVGDPLPSDASVDNSNHDDSLFPINIADMVKEQTSDDGEEAEELVQCMIKEESATQPEFIDTSKGYYKIQLRPEKRKLDSPNNTTDPQNDTKPPKRKTESPDNTGTEDLSYLEQLQIKRVENEIVHKEIMFNHNIEHANKMDNLNYQILKLEYEHKKKYYTMIEEEQEIKISHKKKFYAMVEAEQELKLSRLKKGNLCFDRPDA